MRFAKGAMLASRKPLRRPLVTAFGAGFLECRFRFLASLDCRAIFFLKIQQVALCQFDVADCALFVIGTRLTYQGAVNLERKFLFNRLAKQIGQRLRIVLMLNG